MGQLRSFSRIVFCILWSLISMVYAHFAVAEGVPVQLSCEWQKSPQHVPGYYRAGGFLVALANGQALFQDQGYFQRRYQPCWVGRFSSCYFSFTDGKGKPYTVVDVQGDAKAGPIKLYLEVQEYFLASLEMNFQQSYISAAVGDQLEMVLTGDDGDGVWIKEEKFLCTKL